MTRILLLFFIVVNLCLKSQVTIQNNMPQAIAPNTEITVDITINKGQITNFAKYQMDVPAGAVVKEGDSKGGTFAFENNKVKIIWTMIPSEPALTISVKLLSGDVGGTAVINQKFYYMEEGARKEIEADPINVTFSGAGIKPETNLSSAATQTQNAAISNMQAAQLKKDSKDAYETGIKEKEAAEKKLAEANEALKKAETLKNEEEKKAAIEKANTSKQRAETDKAVASKILMLAKSLDDNANEIERLNAANATPAKANPASATTSATPVTDNGIVYKIQLGAFSQNPEKALNKHLGTINIVNEGGMYKVLMGKFTTHEEAAKKRDELLKRSFECFIVAYKDGARVK